MPRSVIVIAFLLLSLVARPAVAERLRKGNSIVALGISGHRGQFVTASSSWFGYPEEVGEFGGEAGCSKFMSDRWTLAISFGYSASRSKTGNQPPSYTNADISRTRSWMLRIGSDRFAFIEDGVALYAGPGVFVTQGRETYHLADPAAEGGTTRGPYSTEIGFNGRIGMYAHIGGRMALFGHVGQSLSNTSAKSGTSKTTWTWWSSENDGAVGLAFEL